MLQSEKEVMRILQSRNDNILVDNLTKTRDQRHQKMETALNMVSDNFRQVSSPFLLSNGKHVRHCARQKVIACAASKPMTMLRLRSRLSADIDHRARHFTVGHQLGYHS